MYRTTLRAATRPAIQGLRSTAVRSVAQRRFASNVPADKPRSWKGLVARLGLAGGAVYLYSTGAVTFGEEANPGFHTLHAPAAAFDDKDLPTVESVLEEKKKQIKEKLEKPAKPATSDKAPATPSAASSETSAPSPKPAAAEAPAPTSPAEPGSPQALEEEAGQQGAFNPETGEINWDCPCLGGMAHGPCGEDFKAAFSCFVYSEEEPKGMDCIEKFQGMQECFRKYPEVYGGELLDDEDDNGETPPVEGQQQSTHDVEIKQSAPEPLKAEETPAGDETTKQPPRTHSDAVPAAWEDATADNKNPDAERRLPGQVQEGEEKKDGSKEEKPKLVVTRGTEKVKGEVDITKE